MSSAGVGAGAVQDHLRDVYRRAFAHMIRVALPLGGKEFRSRRRRAAVDMHGNFVRQIRRRFPIAAVFQRLGKKVGERVLQIRQIDVILRALRSRNTGHDGREIEIEIDRVVDLPFLRNAPQALRLIECSNART